MILIDLTADKAFQTLWKIGLDDHLALDVIAQHEVSCNVQSHRRSEGFEQFLDALED